MDLDKALATMKDKTLKEAERHAKEGNAEGVAAAGRKLEKISQLVLRHRALAIEVEALQRGDEVPEAEQDVGGAALPPSRDMSGARERGRRARQEFLSFLKSRGVTLRPEKGDAIYKRASGDNVGVSYASERQPNKWFMGLPTRGYVDAILLCVSESGVNRLVLDRVFLAKYGASLSRSNGSNGQFKINVVRRGDGEFSVKVRGAGSVPVRELGDTDWLR